MDVLTPLSSSVTSATRTKFDGFIHFCEITPPDDIRVTPGNTVHITGAKNRNLFDTGNPLVDGFLENVVDVNNNLNNLTGSVHITAILSPFAVDGTWEIQATNQLIRGVLIGVRAVGHGTGELQGMTIKYNGIGQEIGVNTCNPNNDSAIIEGVIIASADS
jgi:hypothetical protein